MTDARERNAMTLYDDAGGTKMNIGLDKDAGTRGSWFPTNISNVSGRKPLAQMQRHD